MCNGIIASRCHIVHGATWQSPWNLETWLLFSMDVTVEVIWTGPSIWAVMLEQAFCIHVSGWRKQMALIHLVAFKCAKGRNQRLSCGDSIMKPYFRLVEHNCECTSSIKAIRQSQSVLYTYMNTRMTMSISVIFDITDPFYFWDVFKQCVVSLPSTAWHCIC